jgi:hypothetical protein
MATAAERASASGECVLDCRRGLSGADRFSHGDGDGRPVLRPGPRDLNHPLKSHHLRDGPALMPHLVEGLFHRLPAGAGPPTTCDHRRPPSTAAGHPPTRPPPTTADHYRPLPTTAHSTDHHRPLPTTIDAVLHMPRPGGFVAGPRGLTARITDSSRVPSTGNWRCVMGDGVEPCG